jgi:hypothetical protein
VKDFGWKRHRVIDAPLAALNVSIGIPIRAEVVCREVLLGLP